MCVNFLLEWILSVDILNVGSGNIQSVKNWIDTAMTNSPWEVRPVATFASQQLARYYGETGQKLLISSGEGRTFAAVVALRIAVSYKVWLFGAPGDISEEDKHRTG